MKKIVWRIVQFPLTRIVLAFFMVMIPAGIVQSLYYANRETMPVLQNPVIGIGASVLMAAVALLMYFLYVRAIEKRAVSELSARGMGRELGAGVLFGALLFTITIAILWGLGSYRIVGMNAWTGMLPAMALSISSAVVEEVVFRGILFRIVQESLGSWLALIISALIFGALHLANPNATLFGGLAIALEAGLMLGAAYMVTRRLWLAIGIHFAWNFTQGGIFGVNVSGNAFGGLFTSALTGPEWLSGGAFGAEASVIAIIVCLCGFAFLYWQARKRGHVVAPFWKQKKTEAALAAQI